MYLQKGLGDFQFLWLLQDMIYFSITWAHKEDLKEPGNAGALSLNLLNYELNKSFCFIKLTCFRYFNSVMEKINRETPYTMEYSIYLYSWLCYCLVTVAYCYFLALQESILVYNTCSGKVKYSFYWICRDFVPCFKSKIS